MGRKPLDLTGKRFGRLTVVGRTAAPEGKGNGNSWWLCKCDCGNTTIVTGIHLKDGKTQSCGCLNQEKRKERFADITGQRFGRLVAIKRLDKRLGGECVWLCKCDCGNFCEVVISNLGKSTLSCGCIKVETLFKDCVDNTRIRNLTAKLSEKRQRNRESGCKGVVWVKSKKKWKATIRLQGKGIHLGYFADEDLDKAIAARKEAEEKYFKPLLEKYSENPPEQGPDV